MRIADPQFREWYSQTSGDLIGVISQEVVLSDSGRNHHQGDPLAETVSGHCMRSKHSQAPNPCHTDRDSLSARSAQKKEQRPPARMP